MRRSSRHRVAAEPSARGPVAIIRRADGTVANDTSADAITAALADPDSVTWVDLNVSDPAQAAMLKDVFHFHPLAVEDALSAESRVKVDEYPTFLVIVVRVVRFCETTPDPYDVETDNLTLFITKNALVTTHLHAVEVIESRIRTIETNPDVLGRGAARMAHYIVDGAVDAYFPIIDKLDEFIDDLEQRVFGKFDEQLLQEIFKIKRLGISLRRYLAPQREVLSVITTRPSAFLPAEVQLYFRDVYDHMLRITDSLDSYRDLLSSTLDGYLTQVSNRLGMVSKSLAVIGALSVPFVVIAGMYGMNFDRIPLAHNPWGFEIMFGVQLALGLALLVVLKRLKWI